MRYLTAAFKSVLIFSIPLLIYGCTNNEKEANSKPWLPDTTKVTLPLEDYLGIPFNTPREEAKEKFGCTAYELSFSCTIKNGDHEEQIWLIYNEAGRMVLMKKELLWSSHVTYFRFDKYETINVLVETREPELKNVELIVKHKTIYEHLYE